MKKKKKKLVLAIRIATCSSIVAVKPLICVAYEYTMASTASSRLFSMIIHDILCD